MIDSSPLSLQTSMKTVFPKIKLETIPYPGWNDNGITISVLREDLVHPYVSGNKHRKLKYNLIDFKNSGRKVILTLGGAFSNHLIATAACSMENNIPAIGIVRGEDVENDYLSFMRKCGMKLHFVSRSDYRERIGMEFLEKITSDLMDKGLIHSPDDLFLIPEGGSNAAGVEGASEIMNEIPDDADIIACACGTGATIAGLTKKLQPNQRALGVTILKAHGYIEKQIINFGGDADKAIIIDDYHFGGYAKTNDALKEFCKNFIHTSGIHIEPVYTGKLFFAIDDLLKKNYFKKGSKVTLIHTGGIFSFK